MELENVFGALALNETLVATNTKLDQVIAELSQKLEAGGVVALSIETLSAIESITASISNLPTDFPDANVLAKLEAIRILLAGTLSTNGLTDAQLRATALAVSLASLPLPTGAATDAKLEAIRIILANQTAGLTDAELRATALAITAASLPLPTGAATEAKLDAILAKIITSPATEAKQDTANTALATIALIDFVKEATMQSIIKQEDEPHTSGDKGIMLLGLRSDSDTATASNGDYTTFKFDEEGRAKISSKPASYPDVTGSITAIQATIATPVAGGTVIGDVSRASNVMMFCTGTFAGINVSFEGSLEATGENWFGVQAVRSNANTIETATGALSAMPVYAWELSVNALSRVRVRCTARTSGTQNWIFKLGTYATEPIPASQVTATQPVSGGVTATTTPANPTVHILNSAATTNATSVKTSAGNIYNMMASNISASPRYLKLFSKASAPTVGTDIPQLTITLPANSFTPINFGGQGFRPALGIAYSITGGPADNDTTVIGANEVKVITSYI